jgi:hypothetical protein
MPVYSGEEGHKMEQLVVFSLATAATVSFHNTWLSRSMSQRLNSQLTL